MAAWKPFRQYITYIGLSIFSNFLIRSNFHLSFSLYALTLSIFHHARPALGTNNTYVRLYLAVCDRHGHMNMVIVKWHSTDYYTQFKQTPNNMSLFNGLQHSIIAPIFNKHNIENANSILHWLLFWSDLHIHTHTNTVSNNANQICTREWMEEYALYCNHIHCAYKWYSIFKVRVVERIFVYIQAAREREREKGIIYIYRHAKLAICSFWAHFFVWKSCFCSATD